MKSKKAIKFFGILYMLSCFAASVIHSYFNTHWGYMAVPVFAIPICTLSINASKKHTSRLFYVAFLLLNFLSAYFITLPKL